MKSSGKKILLIFVLVLAIAAVASLFYFKRPPAVSRKIRNVLLISIDTCRADFLSCYGYGALTTPNIDALAADGVLFSNAIAPVPLTLPSHISMLTGTIPPFHGTHDNHDFNMDQELVTLAEVLKEEGFSTGAVISAFVLDSRTGLDQGFDSYHDEFVDKRRPISIAERTGDETTRFAIEWIEAHHSEPFFLFLHYYDPHQSYQPPPRFAAMFPRNPYAGEIAFADYCIGQVIKKLKALNLYDSTLIIVTSDHGEMLGEHGEITHGYFIYQSVIRVPFVVRLPGGSDKPRKVDDLIGIVDIVPTVCGMLNLEPPADVHGVDLTNCLLKGEPTPPRDYVYCESLYPTKYNDNLNPLLGLVTRDNFKYIKTTRSELYNLAVDPGETKNLIESDPHRARILDDYLINKVLQEHAQDRSDRDAPLDPEVIERLRSLGYVGGSTARPEFDLSKQDPKDFIVLHNKHAGIPHLLIEEKYDEAKKQCNEVLAAHPDFYPVRYHLGRIAIEQGQFEEALTHWHEILDHDPDHFDALMRLAETQVALERLEDSLAVYEQALAVKPDNTLLCNNLGATLARLERFDEAVALFVKSFELYPESKETQANLLTALQRAGRFDEVCRYFEEIVELTPEFRHQAYHEFAVVLAQQNQLAHATKYFYKVLELNPKNVEARQNLAKALAEQGRWEPASVQCKKLLEVAPNNYLAHSVLGEIYLQKKDFDNAQLHLAEGHSLRPDQPDLLNKLARVCRQLGMQAAAVDYWEKALALRPQWRSVMNNLAWTYATSHDPQLRDPEAAVRLALQCCQLHEFKHVHSLDTLAAAYAAAGDFDQAVKTAQRGLELARTEGQERAIRELQMRLELFQAGRPYLEVLEK